MRRLVALFLLAGVFVGFGSAAFSAVRHASGSCEGAHGEWHHQGWRGDRAEPAEPRGGSIQP